MKDAVSQIKQYDYNGKLVRDIKLPGIGSAGGFGGKKEETTLYYSFYKLYQLQEQFILLIQKLELLKYMKNQK